MNFKLTQYKNLKESQSVFIDNETFFKIKDAYAFKVYSFLCTARNYENTFSFASYTTISKKCQIGLTKTKQCIKYLCDLGVIKKTRFKDISNWYDANVYLIKAYGDREEDFKDYAIDVKRIITRGYDGIEDILIRQG